MADRGASLTQPKQLLPVLGAALLLYYVTVNMARDRGASTSASTTGRQSKDLKNKRPADVKTEVCEGLVDLIRDQEIQPEEAMSGPSMTRKQLAHGLLVVVVIGPASTKVHQVRQKMAVRTLPICSCL